MPKFPEMLTNRLAEIGGNLQKIRWEAIDMGYPELAVDIAFAIDAIAWAAGIYTLGANVVDRHAVALVPEPVVIAGLTLRKTATA